MTGTPQTLNDYYERINRVLQFINNHIGDELTLEKLSEISCYSTFHFHRIMKAYLGESVGAYVQRLRLGASANLLRMTSIPVSDIAYKVGYQNPSSFNKAFRKRFGISPSEFRNDIHAELPFDHVKPKKISMKGVSLQPTFVNLKDTKVIYYSALGSYHKSAKEAWDGVCNFAGRNLLFDGKSQFIGISHDDPKVTEPNKCRYEACITINSDVKPQGKVGVKTISYSQFIGAYDYIFGKWIPENSFELRDEPCFEKYINSPDQVEEKDLVTEIYIPLS